ncbi:MAG: polyprenyl synthetase family protein [Pyrinomonadaceae bacterium]
MYEPSKRLSEFFSEASSMTERELDRLIPEQDREPEKLHSAIRHSVFAGGKRLRPSLVFAVGEALGCEPERLVTFAAAVEMTHTYSLIHDDLPSMDDDKLRRGRPTCHIVYGEATAILAGDVLQCLAFGAIADDARSSPETRLRLVSELAAAAGTPYGMVAGQQLDLEGEGAKLTESELRDLHGKKTGALIRAAARGAAAIAGCDEAMLGAVTIFSEKLGLLFQITDDLLDVTQTTSMLGKTAGKDEDVNKSTYVSLFGIDQARALAKQTADEALRSISVLERREILEEITRFVLMRQN